MCSGPSCFAALPFAEFSRVMNLPVCQIYIMIFMCVAPLLTSPFIKLLTSSSSCLWYLSPWCIVIAAQAYERVHSPGGLSSGSAGAARQHSPNPNNPSEYCSTVPPLQQAAASLNNPPPTVMVPVGVLRKEGRSPSVIDNPSHTRGRAFDIM